MANSSCFWKKYDNEEVEVLLRGELHPGKLSVKSHSSYDFVGLHINLVGRDKPGVFEYCNWHEEYSELKVTLKNNKREYLLLKDCEQIQDRLSAKYVLIGKNGNDLPKKFTTIYLYLNGLSHGFFAPMHGEQSDAGQEHECRFKVDTKYCAFDVLLDNGSELKSYWTLDSTSKAENNQQHTIKLDMQYVIKIELTNPIQLDDVVENIRRIQTVFSLLMLTRLTIDNIELGSNEAQYLSKQIPFFIRGKIHDETQLPNETQKHESLIHIQSMDDEIWQRLFNRAYQNNNLLTIWTRFVSGLSYKGFWEYRFLIFISLLERYLQDSYISHGQLSEVKKKIKSLMSETDDFTDEDRKLLDLVKVNLLPKPKILYKKLTEKTPQNLLDMVGFNNGVFKGLLHIRNAIAHLDHDVLDSLGDEEFQKHSLYLNKLIILMAFLAYCELGFSVEEIAEFTTGNLNPILINCDRNEMLIEEIKGNASLDVSKEDFNFIKSEVNFYIVIEKTSSPKGSSYSINEKHTKEINELMLSRSPDKPKDIRELTKIYYPDKECSYVYKFLRYGEENIRKQGMIVDLTQCKNNASKI